MKIRTKTILALAAVLVVTPLIAGEGEGCDPVKCTKYIETAKKAGWVGIELEKDDAGTLTITKVLADSPASLGGFREGDILVAMNGVEINEENHEKLMKIKSKQRPGKKVTYTVKRDGTPRDITVALAPVPADVIAKWDAHLKEHTQVASN